MFKLYKVNTQPLVIHIKVYTWIPDWYPTQQKVDNSRSVDAVDRRRSRLLVQLVQNHPEPNAHRSHRTDVLTHLPKTSRPNSPHTAALKSRPAIRRSPTSTGSRPTVWIP